MVKCNWIFVGVAAAWLSGGALAQTADPAAAQAVRSVLDATDRFATAYGAGAPARAPVAGAAANPALSGSNDLIALMGQFDDDATYAGTLQPFWLRGKAQINDLWSRYFARYPDRRMIFRDRDAKVFGTASVETGFAEMYMGATPASSVPTFLRYSITRMLRDERWIIVSMIVDRIPTDQPPPGTMPPWANAAPAP